MAGTLPGVADVVARTPASLSIPVDSPAPARVAGKKAGFNYAIDNLRGIAIICVILSHSSALYYVGANYPRLWSLVAGATSWFLFISGYLFYVTEHKRFRYADYLQRKARFVLAPYLLIQVCIISISLWQHHNDLYSLDPIPHALWMLVVGSARVGPLWFIPMILLFFIVSPVLMAIARRPMLLAATTALTLAVTFLSGRPHGNMNPILAFVHFAGFYMFGMLLARHGAALRQAAKGRWGLVWIGAALAALALCWITPPSIDGAGGTFAHQWGTLNLFEVVKLAMLVALFMAMQRWLDRPSELLSRTADISFGLFFIHGIVLAVTGKAIVALGIESQIGQIAMEVGLAIFGSAAIVIAIQRLTGRWSRYVVGC